MSRLPKNARILEYKIVDLLGVGGFAHTYHAIDTNLDKKVAIKELFPPRLCRRVHDFRVEPLPGAETQFKSYLKSFIEEARIVAKFDQRNIVKVLRYFEALGTAFIIMEFVDGKPMSAYFAQDNVLGEERVDRWLQGILQGLEAVHGADIIHGDIKPKNIIINEEDEAVLIDFGASDIYRTAFETGESLDELHLSPNYAAPEQLTEGMAIDYRLDLYALGAVFYEAITGEKAAKARQDGIDVQDDILRYGRFYNQKLLSSIGQALQIRPDARFASAGDWLERISLTPVERAGRFLKRNRVAIAAVLLVSCAVAYGTYFAVANEIDGKNYRYKLFASNSEVLALIGNGDRYRAKVRDAVAYLGDYGNEFRVHLEQIGPQNLITGRNNLQSLEAVHQVIDQTIRQLAAIERAIVVLQQKYYFDDYQAPLLAADRVIKDFGERQNAFNRALFNAIVENRIVEQGAAQGIEIDSVALSNLMTALEAQTGPLDLDDMVTQGLPITEDFLAKERVKNAIAAFEALKRTTAQEIRELADDYVEHKRHGEFAAFAEQAETAERPKQVASAKDSAAALAAVIDKERAAAARRLAQKRRAREIRVAVDGIDRNMIEIEPGTFRMGSDKHGYSRPPHTVDVLPFFVLKTEVVNAQWAQCVKSKKCRRIANGKGADFPVTGVTWQDTQAFIAWLNSNSRRFDYRLPSEAEWEYVVKRYGYVIKELESDLSSVSVQQTNKRGINSIVGNALEWLDDCWHGGFVGAPSDSRSWNKGLQCDKRVVRGSNWRDEYDVNQDNVSYFRPFGLPVNETRPTLGFRLAGTLKS